MSLAGQVADGFTRAAQEVKARGRVDARDIVLSGITGNGTVAVPAEFVVLRVEYGGACRFRLYTTMFGALADTSRLVTEDYPGNRDRVYEYLASEAGEEDDEEPFVVQRTPGNSQLYYLVDGGPVTITLTIKEF